MWHLAFFDMIFYFMLKQKLEEFKKLLIIQPDTNKKIDWKTDLLITKFQMDSVWLSFSYFIKYLI